MAKVIRSRIMTWLSQKIDTCHGVLYDGAIIAAIYSAPLFAYFNDGSIAAPLSQ